MILEREEVMNYVGWNNIERTKDISVEWQHMQDNKHASSWNKEEILEEIPINRRH